MIAALLCLALAPPAAADVDRSLDRPLENFREAAAWTASTRGGVYRRRVAPQPIGDGPAFWYRIETGPQRAEFVFVDPVAAVRRPAFDHAAVAAALARRGPPVAADRLPFRTISFPEGSGGPVRFAASGARWRAEGAEVRELGTTTGAGDDGPATSAGLERLESWRSSRSTGPETTVTFENRTAGPLRLFWVRGREVPYGVVAPGETRSQHTYAGHVWVIRDKRGRALAGFVATSDAGSAAIDGPDPNFRDRAERRPAPAAGPPLRVRGGDLWLERPGGEPRRLTDAAAEPVPDGYRRVEYRGPLLPSPDGRTIAVVRTVRAPVRRLTLTQPGPDEPNTVTIPYPKPGDRIDRVAPAFFDAATGRRTDVATDLFPNPWSLSEYRWSRDGSELYFLHNPRGHRSLQLLAANRETGAVRVAIDERSDTFVDYSQKTELHWLGDDGSGRDLALWASERSGWNHLYRVDATAGTVLNAVTSGDWVVRGVEKIKDGRVWFTAGGVVPGQDPYYVHLCRADLDGSNFVVLTSDAAEPGDGTHDWEFLPGGASLLDRFSRVDLPPVTVLRNAETGALVLELERADAAERLATGWTPPVRFVAKGRDGTTDIYGTILFPPGFDPDAAPPGSLPALEYIYAGPHGAFVQKGWGDERSPREFAALGFVVVRCDGMGTNWRSKAFHDVCWRDLADSGFPDRILFLKAVAKAYPAVDLSRVGIYGGSAGGQNALRALLSHGDFYTAAAADCGCHDNRVDKLWWNEAWLGGVGPHYDDSSNVRDARRLTGDLLLTLGGMDRNVDPACTLETAAALEAAGKEFTLKVYPDGGHGVGEREEARELRANFFRDALMNRSVEPRR